MERVQVPWVVDADVKWTPAGNGSLTLTQVAVSFIDNPPVRFARSPPVRAMKRSPAFERASRTARIEVVPDLSAASGDAPRGSVTDESGRRLRGAPNVVVADGSLSVSSGGAYPTLTIVALALTRGP